jgi:hypothetical protein
MVHHTKMGNNVPNDQNYTKIPLNTPNVHKNINFSIPKFTKIKIFGMKMYHLATLHWR